MLLERDSEGCWAIACGVDSDVGDNNFKWERNTLLTRLFCSSGLLEELLDEEGCKRVGNLPRPFRRRHLYLIHSISQRDGSRGHLYIHYLLIRTYKFRTEPIAITCAHIIF
jgi:hypothetical protein